MDATKVWRAGGARSGCRVVLAEQRHQRLACPPYPSYRGHVRQSVAASNSDDRAGNAEAAKPYVTRRLYVGNLKNDVTRPKLQEVFKPFGTVESVHLPTQPGGKRRGYGFVTYEDVEAAKRARTAMQGKVVMGREISVSFAAVLYKRTDCEQSHDRARQETAAAPNGNGASEDTTAATRRLYVGNLRYDITPAKLQGVFEAYGPVESVHLPTQHGKRRGFGFVTYEDLEAAKEARNEMQGKIMMGRQINVGFAASLHQTIPRDELHDPIIRYPALAMRELQQLETCEELLQYYADHGPRLNERHVCQIMTSLARSPQADRALLAEDERLQQLLRDTAARVEEYGARAVITILHKAAKLSAQNTVLLSAIETHAEQLASAASAQELSNLMWACATLQVESPRIYSAVEEQAERLARDGAPQAMSTSLWAFAKLGLNAPRLTAAVEGQAERLASQGAPQEVSITVWAVTKMATEAPALLAAVSRQAERLAHKGNPQELANIVWGYATLRVQAPDLFEAVARQADRLVSDANPAELAKIVWAFTTMGLQLPDVFGGVELSFARQDLGRNLARTDGVER